MKILNTHNLPPGLVNIVKSGQYPPRKDRFSVTDLINPPLIRTLKYEKWDELETDVADYIWLLIGIGVDNLISSSTDKGSIRQHKMEYQIDDYTIVGKTDVINEDVLADYKVTGVQSSFYPIKEEYIAQLNVYCWMLQQERKEGPETIPIRYLKLYNIYRDWKVGEKYKPGYPPVAFEVRDVPKWTEQQQKDYIYARLDDHINNPYRPCTKSERWMGDTVYAVKSKGKKRAERLLDSEEEAKAWMKKYNKGDSIEIRLGEPRRCLNYCPVSSVCKCKGCV